MKEERERRMEERKMKEEERGREVGKERVLEEERKGDFVERMEGIGWILEDQRRGKVRRREEVMRN